MRAFLLNHDFGCISSVFGLPAPVSMVSREGLALQGGKIIEESESSDIWSSDKISGDSLEPFAALCSAELLK